jgi:hypothetical protein
VLATGVLIILNKNDFYMMYEYMHIEDCLVILYVSLIILVWFQLREIIFKKELILLKAKKKSNKSLYKFTFIDFLAGIFFFIYGNIGLMGTTFAEFEIVDGVEIITHTHNKNISFNENVIVKQIPYVGQDGNFKRLLENGSKDLKTLESSPICRSSGKNNALSFCKEVEQGVGLQTKHILRGTRIALEYPELAHITLEDRREILQSMKSLRGNLNIYEVGLRNLGESYESRYEYHVHKSMQYIINRENIQILNSQNLALIRLEAEDLNKSLKASLDYKLHDFKLINEDAWWSLNVLKKMSKNFEVAQSLTSRDRQTSCLTSLQVINDKITYISNLSEMEPNPSLRVEYANRIVALGEEKNTLMLTLIQAETPSVSNSTFSSRANTPIGGGSEIIKFNWPRN